MFLVSVRRCMGSESAMSEDILGRRRKVRNIAKCDITRRETLGESGIKHSSIFKFLVFCDNCIMHFSQCKDLLLCWQYCILLAAYPQPKLCKRHYGVKKWLSIACSGRPPTLTCPKCDVTSSHYFSPLTCMLHIATIVWTSSECELWSLADSVMVYTLYHHVSLLTQSGERINRSYLLFLQLLCIRFHSQLVLPTKSLLRTSVLPSVLCRHFVTFCRTLCRRTSAVAVQLPYSTMTSNRAYTQHASAQR